MLFKAELAQKIVDGVKTQTRRPVKAGEVLVVVDGKKTVKAGGRIKWQVGREYSVQYGRGLPTRLWGQNGDNPYLMPYVIYQDIQSGKLESNPALIPLKIRVKDIWLEDVRKISNVDAMAEGFEHPTFTAYWGFIETWTAFYDKTMNKPLKEDIEFILRDTLMARPAELYQAWALKFEVVR